MTYSTYYLLSIYSTNIPHINFHGSRAFHDSHLNKGDSAWFCAFFFCERVVGEAPGKFGAIPNGSFSPRWEQPVFASVCVCKCNISIARIYHTAIVRYRVENTLSRSCAFCALLVSIIAAIEMYA